MVGKCRQRVPMVLLLSLSPSSRCCSFVPAAKWTTPVPSTLTDSYRKATIYRKERINNDDRTYCSLRGGAVDSKSLRHDGDGEEECSRQEMARRRGMGLALANTYFSVMAAKCALPSVLSLLIKPKVGLTFSKSWSASPQQLIARQLTLSTLAIALGKILLGPVIDYFGGVLSLRFALSLLGILLGVLTLSQSFLTFAICWIFVDFIFSSCWASCINAIHQSFPEPEWAKRIGMLAAAARTGNAAAFAFFASLLLFAEEKMNQPWRVVFGASALLQVIPMVLLTRYGNMPVSNPASDPNDTRGFAIRKPITMTRVDSNNSNAVGRDHPSMKTSLATLRREACTAEFWLHLVSRSVLMVFASFLLFVPLLMNNVYGASTSFSSVVGTIYALGCLLSVTLGSNLYARLSKRRKALSVLMMLGGSTLSSIAQLGHMAGWWQLSIAVSAASFFLWGFSFSIPFYLPPSLYALARGGVNSSATIADVFDIGGFGLLAAFNGYVAGISHATAASWIATFQLTTGCSAIALVALTLAVMLE